MVYILGPEPEFAALCDVEGQNGWIFPQPAPILFSKICQGLK